jgi:hypothetical protein
MVACNCHVENHPPCLAQFVLAKTTDDITPLGLRAPEIVLGGEWDESVDVWTFGCVVRRFFPSLEIPPDAKLS